ncbi:MAG: DUF2848 domain-containing protein [Pseudomonadota bacterium]
MRFKTPDGTLDLPIDTLIVAGWTGRDRAAVDHHIAELAEIGVPPPSEVPLYYRVSTTLLTAAPAIQVLGPDTSGEVEPLILRAGGQTWLGLASDHTDRALETVSVAASKQVCAKPVSPALWRFDDVADHLDQLELVCDIEEDGAWVRYQEGTLASIRPLTELVAAAGLDEGCAMLCGTLAARGGVRPARAYRMALRDPVRAAELTLAYSAAPLPVVA